MGLKSFKNEEGNRIATFPNFLTAVRAVGGVILGGLIGTGHVDPTTAFYAGTGLYLTDLEGVSIMMTSRFPRLQKALRIEPSSFGREADPVADKIWAISMFIGNAVAGVIPEAQAVPILATEAATASTTLYVKHKGGEPETSLPGTFGLVARGGNLLTNMAIPAFTEQNHVAHEVLANAASATAVASVALGAISCYLVARTPIPTELGEH